MRGGHARAPAPTLGTHRANCCSRTGWVPRCEKGSRRAEGQTPDWPSLRTATGSAPGGARIALFRTQCRVCGTPALPRAPLGRGLILQIHTARPTRLTVSLPRTGDKGRLRGSLYSTHTTPPPPAHLQAPRSPVYVPRDTPPDACQQLPGSQAPRLRTKCSSPLRQHGTHQVIDRNCRMQNSKASPFLCH